jgi:hypothetical protein
MLEHLGLIHPSLNHSQINHASKDPKSESGGEDVFAEFWRVTILMSLLAAISSKGHQVLDYKEYQADRNFDAIPVLLQQMQPVHQLVLAAFSMLLV